MHISQTGSRRFAVQAILFEGSLAAVALAVGWLLPTPPWRQIQWTLEAAAIGAAAAVPLLAVMLALRAAHGGPFGRLNRLVDHVVVPLFAGCSVADFAVIAIVAGFGEELLFRGVIQAALAEWLGAAAGLVLASLLFGAAHIITPTYAVLAASIGACLGGLAIYTENLLAPIVTHAVYDFVALVYLTRGRRGAVNHEEHNGHEGF
jgi:hypothetical protein